MWASAEAVRASTVDQLSHQKNKQSPEMASTLHRRKTADDLTWQRMVFTLFPYSA